MTKEAVEAHFNNTVFVLHGGGQYGDKKAALKRWGETYQNLPKHIKYYLALENDERNFNPMDLLPFCEKHKIPLVIDFFHQECYELMHPDEPTCVWSEVIPRVRKI